MKKATVLVLLVLSAFGDSFNGGGGGGSSSSIGPSAKALNSTTQSITGLMNTALTFNTNSWDTCSSCTIHSTSTNPTRFTAPSTGFYLVSCTTFLSTSVTFDLIFDVNGSALNGSSSVIGTAGNSFQTSASITDVVKLNSGDFIECIALLASTTTTSANQSSMSLTKLSTTF